MTYVFHPEAAGEFRDSIEYYEACEEELGLDFSLEVHSTIQRILDFPDTWPILEDGVRRCLVSRFPYGILYCIEPDQIYILAVMPLQKDPDYWKHRK